APASTTSVTASRSGEGRHAAQMRRAVRARTSRVSSIWCPALWPGRVLSRRPRRSWPGRAIRCPVGREEGAAVLRLRSNGIAWREVEGETLLLDLRTSMYL